jgi:hypothetical protein
LRLYGWTVQQEAEISSRICVNVPNNQACCTNVPQIM